MHIITLSKTSAEEAIKQANVYLHNGGLVIYPTETCYGLGADVTNQQAINQLLVYKRRREGKPLSVLVADQVMAERYVVLNESALHLYKRFLPGPMTIISTAKQGVLAQGVASELGTLGIRISSHSFASQLVTSYDAGITATSANASWQKKPYTIDDILKPLSEKQKQRLNLIIDAGTLPKRPASTVVDTTMIEAMVLRKGDLVIEGTSKQLISHSAVETEQLMQRLMLQHWNILRKHGLLIALIGDLGVGKTVCAQGIGTFLRITDRITSPSYTLLHEYAYQRHGVQGMFYHCDPWRLNQADSLSQLGLGQMLKPNNIIAVEWANKYLLYLKKIASEHKSKVLEISLEDIGNHDRKIIFSD